MKKEACSEGLASSFPDSAVRPSSCLSASQLSASFHSPTFSRRWEDARPQLSRMPWLLDVWTKLGERASEREGEGERERWIRRLLSESDPVGRDGWKCLPLWFPGEQRQKTNGDWLPYFLKVPEVDPQPHVPERWRSPCRLARRATRKACQPDTTE